MSQCKIIQKIAKLPLRQHKLIKKFGTKVFGLPNIYKTIAFTRNRTDIFRDRNGGWIIRGNVETQKIAQDYFLESRSIF